MNQELIDQYKILHQKSKGYGKAASFLSEIIRLCKNNDLNSVLDFGCGKFILGSKLKESGIECDGYDPAIYEYSKLSDRVYDLVVCNDVLEHLHQDDYKSDIELIRGLSSKAIFFNISCRPAKVILPNGDNAHSIVRTPNEWISDLIEILKMDLVYSRYNYNNRNLVLFFIK